MGVRQQLRLMPLLLLLFFESLRVFFASSSCTMAAVEMMAKASLKEGRRSSIFFCCHDDAVRLRESHFFSDAFWHSHFALCQVVQRKRAEQTQRLQHLVHNHDNSGSNPDHILVHRIASIFATNNWHYFLSVQTKQSCFLMHQ